LVERGDYVEDLVMQITLSIAVLVGVIILGRMPYDVSLISGTWVTAAAASVVMISTFYQALYQWRIQRELEYLNRMLAGEEQMNPGFRGTVERLRMLVREFHAEERERIQD